MERIGATRLSGPFASAGAARCGAEAGSTNATVSALLVSLLAETGGGEGKVWTSMLLAGCFGEAAD